MAVKKSRTGKKRRPQYGPQGAKVQEAVQMTREEYANYKKARRVNVYALLLLLVAMAILLIAPNALKTTVANNIAVMFAYACTMASGWMMLYTVDYVIPERVKLTRITGWVMVAVGLFGLSMTAYGLVAFN